MTNTHTVLYNRKQDYIPRIAAIHDLCGYGKCSLGVAIPVLSAAGCDVCSVPTALFSSHTKYPVFAMHDTTSFLPDFLDAWKSCPVDLDAIYSGFLGSAEQVDIIQRVWSEYPSALRIVDPVMGDAGAMYATYTPELCEAMKLLVSGATLLTPNLTEASILTGIPYEGQQVREATITKILDELHSMGAQHICLKGVLSAEKPASIFNIISSAHGTRASVESELLPYMLHGTGDLFASGLLASIMAGETLLKSVEFASTLVIESMKVTCKQPDFEMRGVSFETQLWRVANLLHYFYAK